MKHSNESLALFGATLRTIRKELRIHTDLLAADLNASKRLYNGV